MVSEIIDDMDDVDIPVEEIEKKGELVFENRHSIGPLAADDVFRIYRYKEEYWADGGYDGEWAGPFDAIDEILEEGSTFLSIAPDSADVTIVTREWSPSKLAQLLRLVDADEEDDEYEEDDDSEEDDLEEDGDRENADADLSTDEPVSDDEVDERPSITINNEVWEVADNGKLRRSE